MRAETPQSRRHSTAISGLVARNLTNPRPAGHALVDLEAQRLGGRLRIGGNSNIDEIGHGISPSRILTPNSGASLTSDCIAVAHCTIAQRGHISRYWHKNSMRIGT